MGWADRGALRTAKWFGLTCLKRIILADFFREYRLLVSSGLGVRVAAKYSQQTGQPLSTKNYASQSVVVFNLEKLCSSNVCIQGKGQGLCIPALNLGHPQEEVKCQVRQLSCPY